MLTGECPAIANGSATLGSAAPTPHFYADGQVGELIHTISRLERCIGEMEEAARRTLHNGLV